MSLAAPNESEGGGESLSRARGNDPFSQNYFLFGGGPGGGGISDIVARAEALFPFTYDRGANNGNGQYTWKDSSFGNETLAAVDASQQFPSGGFLGGGFGDVQPSTALLLPAAVPAIVTKPASTAAAPVANLISSVPSWVWWVALALIVFSLIPLPKRVRLHHVR